MNEASKILNITGGGLAVFQHYFGDICTRKVFCNPFRGDTSPSCHLYLNKCADGTEKYFLHDFGDSTWNGDCFTIVARICNKNARSEFHDVLKIIDGEMNLGVFDGNANAMPVKKLPMKVKPINTSRPIGFIPYIQEFSDSEKRFWDQYGIDQQTLARYNVYSLSRCDFEREDGTEFSTIGSVVAPCFAYFFNGITGVKLYRPKSKVRFLYGGELPKPYVFGWEQLPESEKKQKKVFITGGEKDTLSLASHGYNAIAFNSESASIPENMIKELSEHFEHVIFCYDMDTTGIQESKARVSEFSGKYSVYRIELPLPGTKQSKDISDFFKEGHTADELDSIVEKAISKEGAS
jgi:hypothetical protein